MSGRYSHEASDYQVALATMPFLSLRVGKGIHMPTHSWLTNWTPVLLPLMTLGCCAIGDPSCDVPRELYGIQLGREFAYCPDTAIEGLPRQSWYCDPYGWAPECPPALRCGPSYPPPATSRTSVYALPNIRPLPPRSPDSLDIRPDDVPQNSQPTQQAVGRD